jgi:hypothetical protein
MSGTFQISKIAAAAAAVLFAYGSICQSATYDATPSNYNLVLPKLKAGDVLNLGSGTYSRLNINSLTGTASARITIQGPGTGAQAVIIGQPGFNTVEIKNSSHVTVKNLRIDSGGLPSLFGLSAGGGSSNQVHNIWVENCTFVGQNGSQQTVGISTKAPTWGWTIRNNTIIGAGTGVYLGSPDGTNPFIAGVIEGNLFRDTIGYNMEIKWQRPRPSITGMPTGTSNTLIRHNVFIKNNNPCGSSGCRPNLLVGGFPVSGAGMNDTYQVYGNFFFNNPYESLFQASGRVYVHDNLFVNSHGTTAIYLMDHNLPLKLGHVYNNTIYSGGRGVYGAQAPDQGHSVVGNLIFSGTPIAGALLNKSNNVTATTGNASSYVNSPNSVLGTMNFYPVLGSAAWGGALSLSAYSSNADYREDFNGQAKGSNYYRGAYQGEGTSPGWRPSATRKPIP